MVREDIEEHMSEYPDLASELRVLTNGMLRKWAIDGRIELALPEQPSSIRSLVNVVYQ